MQPGSSLNAMVLCCRRVELQLKPTHIPFKLVCYWEELLEKYSAASEYDRQRGEIFILLHSIETYAVIHCVSKNSGHL